MVRSFVGLLGGTGAGDGCLLLTMRVPPGLLGIELATQAAVLDAAGALGLLSTSNGVMVRIE